MWPLASVLEDSSRWAARVERRTDVGLREWIRDRLDRHLWLRAGICDDSFLAAAGQTRPQLKGFWLDRGDETELIEITNDGSPERVVLLVVWTNGVPLPDLVVAFQVIHQHQPMVVLRDEPRDCEVWTRHEVESLEAFDGASAPVCGSVWISSATRSRADSALRRKRHACKGWGSGCSIGSSAASTSSKQRGTCAPPIRRPLAPRSAQRQFENLLSQEREHAVSEIAVSASSVDH